MTEPLRPMSVGQLLDRTVALYRKNFILFTGIAVVGPASRLVFRLLTVGMRVVPVAAGTRGAAAAASRVGMGLLAGYLVLLAGLAISHAATVRAVAAVHLNHNITIAGVYRSLRGRLGRVLGVFFLVMLICAGAALAILVVLIIGLIAGLVGVGGGAGRSAFAMGASAGIVAVLAFVAVYVRYALAIQACVVEDLGVRDSLSRSVSLSQGSRWRIGIIYGAFLILSWIAGYGLNYLARKTGSLLDSRIAFVTLFYLSSFVAGSITAPLSTIGISLVYYDERVRKEAFDLQLMLASLETPVLPVPVQT